MVYLLSKLWQKRDYRLYNTDLLKILGRLVLLVRCIRFRVSLSGKEGLKLGVCVHIVGIGVAAYSLFYPSST